MSAVSSARSVLQFQRQHLCRHCPNLVDTLKLKADEAHVIRSLLGHVVAGTASDVEARELREFSRRLTAEQLKKR